MYYWKALTELTVHLFRALPDMGPVALWPCNNCMVILLGKNDGDLLVLG